jgi:outer membrane protein OmpA-like peptidoglycan-associated protein
MRFMILSALVLLGACSLVTVKQDPFPPLDVQAERPEPPPKKAARVVLTDSAIEIKEKVMFDTGSAEILEQSHGLLTEVAAMLKDNPQIELMDVEGHTDSVGGARMNKRLSTHRAESVVTFLVEAGVEDSRLEAKGYGPEKPIADNESEEGRDQNRRVEFNIVKQGKKKTLVEDED